MSGLKIIASVLLMAALSGCTNLRVMENWPRALPPQRHFISAYHDDTDNQIYQSDVEYLTWVVRFYQGWELMPYGWKDIVASMMLDLDADQSVQMSESLRSLGVLISTEWAKDNRTRMIDSAMLSLWGSVMQADFSSEFRFAAVDLISADVAGLLAGDLCAGQINDQRYIDALSIELDF